MRPPKILLLILLFFLPSPGACASPPFHPPSAALRAGGENTSKEHAWRWVQSTAMRCLPCREMHGWASLFVFFTGSARGSGGGGEPWGGGSKHEWGAWGSREGAHTEISTLYCHASPPTPRDVRLRNFVLFFDRIRSRIRRWRWTAREWASMREGAWGFGPSKEVRSQSIAPWFGGISTQRRGDEY
jgi:hypothetical protein